LTGDPVKRSAVWGEKDFFKKEMCPDNFCEGEKETKTRLIETPLSAWK